MAPIAIRPARTSDAEALADLAGQLGYAGTAEQMRTRLGAMGAARAEVFVAEIEGRVVGWIALRGDVSLEAGPLAEISGLVVDETYRGGGIGAKLTAEGERWARERGYPRIRVRSRVARERAHHFYERLGYRERKTQKVFDKALD
jgi:ribosomal protein S18 acetylase RimI-like enzyme